MKMKGLSEYIVSRYRNAVEIGIGHFPDIAFDLLGRRVRVFATDITQFRYEGLKVIVDDITEPDIPVYQGSDLIYSIRPPMELVPYMKRIAGKISADLVVKPLSSEYMDGQLIRQGDTTFHIWNYSNNKYK